MFNRRNGHYGSCKPSSPKARGLNECYEKLLAFAILALAILPVNASETLLVCDLCQNCRNPQPRSSIKIDFDKSIVTQTFSPQNIASFRATITSDFVQWDTGGGWRMTLNRLTGETRFSHPNKSTDSIGHCSIAGPRIGE
jgi:hypothetical protein